MIDMIDTKKDMITALKKSRPSSYFVPGAVIKVNDKMQKYQYTLTEKINSNFAEDFEPELTPKEILELGAFEGKYMNDCINEFPRSWFTKKVLEKLSPEGPNPDLNYYKIKSRQSLQVWQKKKWIIKPDVRGWFQWYCRYYIGRRLPDVDARQISRWRSFIRHRAQVVKNCKSNNSCRIKQRQALLQWAYDPRNI
jgi:hypothetical protein